MKGFVLNTKLSSLISELDHMQKELFESHLSRDGEDKLRKLRGQTWMVKDLSRNVF